MDVTNKKFFNSSNIDTNNGNKIYIIIIISMGIGLIIYKIQQYYASKHLDVFTINYSNINYINVYMSYIVIGVSLYIFIQYYASIFAKRNIGLNMFTNGSNTSFIDLNMSSFNNYFKAYVNYMIASTISPMNCRLDYQKQEIGHLNQTSTEFSENIQKNIQIEQANNLVNYQNLYIDSQTNIHNLKTTIEQINDAYLANNEYVKNIYTTYSTKLTGFVNNLFKVLNVLQYQFNLAYITPTLNTTIQPIKNLYTSIYNILINNPDYVKQYVTDYTISDLKPISQQINSPQNLSSNFTNSNKLFQNLNY